MPYAAELSRTNPTCFVFLIDQSSSMAEPFGAPQGYVQLVMSNVDQPPPMSVVEPDTPP